MLSKIVKTFVKDCQIVIWDCQNCYYGLPKLSLEIAKSFCGLSKLEIGGHSGIFAQNFIQIYTNPHLEMVGVFKEAERIKEFEFVVKLRCFSAKIE